MENEYVRVELIANPSVKRTMSKNSLRVNSNKWREIGAAEPEKPVKKKDVVPAGSESTDEIPVISTSPTVQEADPELVELRAQYEAKFNKPADKRMKADKLKAKLNEA